MDSLSVRMAHAATGRLQALCIKEVIKGDGRSTMTMPDGSVIIQRACGQRKVYNKECSLVEALQITPSA